MPAAHDWHKQLLEQMSRELPGVKPPVISAETCDRLDVYRGFRHLFQHRYGFDLAWAEMAPLLETAEQTIDLLVVDLESFCDFLISID